MSKVSVKLIYNLIKKTIGAGPHKLHEPLFIGNEIKYVTDTIKKNFVSSSGQYVDMLEKKIRNFTKANYSISVINGTQAIYIALKVLGVKTGQEILVPSLTFVGTVNAISYTGAIPHFIDSNIKDLGVDCKKLEVYLKKNTLVKADKCINKKTGMHIAAIIPVHIFGHSCDLAGIIGIAKRYKLKIVEDAAEALGSFYKKKHLGLFGDIGCLSFNGNKIITTGGGGAIITNKKYIAKKIKHLITTAKIEHKWEYLHDKIGYNFRLPNLNAALGVAQLENLNYFLKLKRKLFQNYSQNFFGVDGLSIFKEGKNIKSNYWLQTLVLDNKQKKIKNKILHYCYKKKIYLRPAWKLISKLKPYRKCQRMDLSGAKDIYDRVVNLPSSQSIILKNLQKKTKKTILKR